MTLAELNSASVATAQAALLDCCGSPLWADNLLLQRPFADLSALYALAEQVWWAVPESEWLAAFRKHPKIGERVAPTGDRHNRWSTQEQQGMSRAAASTADGLRELNLVYEAKFGWIFIVCATGKSADEMRLLLNERLPNDPATEIRIAASEQAKITRLRLEKLLSP